MLKKKLVQYPDYPNYAVLGNGNINHEVFHMPSKQSIPIYVRRENAEKRVLSVDLSLTKMCVGKSAGEDFLKKWEEYIKCITKDGRKGGRIFYCNECGSCPSVSCLFEDAGEWMDSLWELCSNPDNLAPIPF